MLVVVSSNLNMKKLRQRIAQEVNLDLSAQEEDRAAQLLFNNLMGRKFFLILDDIWERIDLDTLGVPIPTNTNGCKVALTTRKITVCRLMETDKEIHLSHLPENEAWELFSEKAGGVISSSIESTARLVCEECHGLPLALIVVRRALRKENDVGVWNYALKSLRSSQFDLEGMEKDVFSPLKFSYNYLKSDTLKECFLYCALFPEDEKIDIDCLISYWVTQGLVELHRGFGHALDKGRHEILKELLDSCLLERYEDDKAKDMNDESVYMHDVKNHQTVYMHDVIRDMAIKITCERGTRFLVDAGKGLDGWMGANDLNDVDKINLTDNNIKALPDAPNCPKLSTLLLTINLKLEHIPDSFFTAMLNLRVLDLSCTNIKSLPQSISGLVNLQALILQSCSFLKDITHIESLRRLMLLDLSHTEIAELPDGIGELNGLRSLDLSCTYKLERISTGMLSKLTSLEFLEMKDSAYFGGASKEGVIHDIGCLSHLQHLSLDVKSDHNVVCLILPKFKELVSFYVQLDPIICRRKDYYDLDGFSKKNIRCLEFGHITHSSHRIFELACYANKLVVRDMDRLDSVSSLGVGNLKNLKELKVVHCESIWKAIIDDQEQILLPDLEVLEVGDNRKLPCIWEAKGVVGTFRSLKLIDLYGCQSATHVFSINVISELGCLEQLKIRKCENMEEIVRGLDNQSRKFPKLEYLHLWGLSSLKALWEQQVFLPALKEICIIECGTLKHLPVSQEIAPSLGCIEGQQKWWDDLTWTSQAAGSYFQPLYKHSNYDVERISRESEESHTSSWLTTKERLFLQQILYQIWQLILDPGIKRIGIWGKGGIGKSTIIKNIINSKLCKTTHFDIVIFVVVSSDLNMKRLRQRIAEQIHLDVSGQEDNIAAQLLFQKLIGRKFFIVFDDIWERIDLDALGVPSPTNTNGCKVALTTRKLAVCRLMKTDKKIHLSGLPKNEAWELFSEKAGGAISPSTQSFAKLVCEECHGLPLALVVVGRAMRRETDVDVWEHALNCLRSSQFELEGMEKEFFSPLKFSYDRLTSDALRECFLYCVLFPEGYHMSVDSLIRYWITEGLIDLDKGFVHALDKGRHDILKELLDSNLLERYENDQTIYMHNLIRDMAIKIRLQSGTRLLINVGKGLDGWMGTNDLNNIDKINLRKNDIETLPDAPSHPKLSTLLLESNTKLEHIPESFFTSMINLRVLDLSGTNIKSLPPSISELVNLRALQLQSCHSLTEITQIGSLRSSLMLLDLRDTRITELPDGIGELNRLRSIDLSFTYKLQRIPAGTLSKLSNLEFLEMQGSAYFGGESKEGVIHDIGCLSHLQHLSLDVSSDHDALSLMFPKLKKLVSFYIQLNPVVFNRKSSMGKAGFSKRNRRCLELGNITQLSPIVFGLAHYANRLVVRDMEMLDCVSSLGIDNLKNLKQLEVYSCHSISKAICDDDEQTILPDLDVLELEDNIKLPCIWEVKGVPGTFRSIKLLVLRGCTSATHVFSISVISQLGCLENLKISNCSKMEQIVRGVDNQSKTIPKLKSLELNRLNSLKALWEQPLFLPALREIKVILCLNLKHLPLSKKIAPSLGCIEGQDKWWYRLTWTNEAAGSYFRPLFKPTNET